MDYISLLETGIKTASIDTQAKEIIKKEAGNITEDLIALAKENVGLNGEEDDNRWHTFYEKASVYFSDHVDQIVKSIGDRLSDKLTKLVIQHTTDIFKNPVVRGTHLSDIKVDLEIKELSTDAKAKSAGGYFNERNALMKVFLERDKILSAARNLVTEHIFGESEESGSKLLIQAIASTFSHEYAHLEQKLRGKNFNWSVRKNQGRDASDYGYIIGGKGKGGLRRGGDTELDNILYHGAAHEIDSFAAGAASEIATMCMDRTRSNDSFEYELTNLLNELKYGYGMAGSNSYYRYFQLMRNTIDGYYKEHNIKPEQMQIVWQRFQKKVYQKLGGYLSASMGKADVYDKKNLNPRWVEFAKTMPRAKTFQFLAGIVAAKSILDDPSTTTADDLMRYNPFMNEAEKFISAYYFGNQYQDEAQEKTLDVFRRMVRAEITEKLAKKNGLTESRLIKHRVEPEMVGQYLYHGTSIQGLIEILASNTILGSRDKVGLTGVSCTTKLWWAQNYARGKAGKETWNASGEITRPLVMDAAGKGNGPVLVLDAQKIVKDFEVRAVSWTKKSPVEERIVGDLTPLLPYLIRVEVDHDTLALYKQALEERLRTKPSPIWQKRYDDFIALLSSDWLK